MIQVAVEHKANVKTMNVLEGAPDIDAQVAAKPAKAPDTRKVIAALQAQVAALQAQVAARPQGEAKQPVTDDRFDKAIAEMRADHRKDALTASRSLGKYLGFAPELSEAKTMADGGNGEKISQKQAWRAARKELEALHSSAVRAKKEQVQADCRVAWSTPRAIIGYRRNVRKGDGKLTSFRFGAKSIAEPVKGVKGRGKGAAKPQNPVANVPKAGNANPPAQVR